MIRIGNGGYSGYSIDAGKEVLKDGVDYLIMDYLSEGSMAEAQHTSDTGEPGYSKETFGTVMRSFLPLAAEEGTTIITNAGAAEPTEAGLFARDIADEVGVDLEVTAIEGADCRDMVRERPDEFGVDPDEMVSAAAYIGTEETVGALEQADNDGDVHLVIGTRIADPSLIVTPIVHEFDIDLDDWDTLGQAMVVGHLLENDAHSTGGYYMEPGRKPVPDPHKIGYPIAEVEDPERAIITKPESSGGRVARPVLQEQMFYEVHDPAEYKQADVTADFTDVSLTDVGENRVEVTGGTGKPRPETMKVTIGREEGYLVGTYATYGGPNAEALARLAGEIAEKRVNENKDLGVDLQINVVGVDALFDSASKLSVDFDSEVMVRIAGRVEDRETAKIVKREIDSAVASPLGPHCGARGPDIPIEEILGVDWGFIPREEVTRTVSMNKLKNY